jgi:hypothetical protein
MPVIQCHIADCEYETPEVDAVVVATQKTTHATVHSVASSSAAAAKVEKVNRPTVSLAELTEDWSYFLSRWKDYVAATKVTGRDLVVQILEIA